MNRQRQRLHWQAIVYLAPFFSVVACKQLPPDAAECPEEGTTGDLCGNDTGAPIPESMCANPEFVGEHADATKYECMGRAGGAIVYNQVEIKIGGETKAGPGAVRADPEITEFPSGGTEVAGCCAGEVSADEVQDGACEYDCGRAACNQVLEQLRGRAAADDPSDGDCNALPSAGLVDGCQNRLRTSLEGWIAQIEANYDLCVTAAVLNDDPNLPYDDIGAAFSDERQLVFTDPDCNHEVVGCLFDARLRPFCEIDSFEAAGPCDAAQNPVDPEGAAADGGPGADTTAGFDGELADPFADAASQIDCSPGTPCTIARSVVDSVAGNFHVFYDDDVSLSLGTWATGVTGLKFVGIDRDESSRVLMDRFRIANNDVITHVNGTAVDGWDDVALLLAEIDSRANWSVRVRRRQASAWATREYTIVVASAVSTEAAVGDVSGDGAGCGCGQGQRGGLAGTMLFAMVAGAAIRRRRR